MTPQDLLGRQVKVFEDPWTERILEFEGTIVKTTADLDFFHAVVKDPDGSIYSRKIRRDGRNFPGARRL
jgi:hypothetical protein